MNFWTIVSFWLFVVSILCFVLLLLLRRSIRNTQHWRDIAKLSGVKQLWELPDGDYRRTAFFKRIGRFDIYRIYDVSGSGDSSRIIAVFPAGSLMDPEFTVKNGQISEEGRMEAREIVDESG